MESFNHDFSSKHEFGSSSNTWDDAPESSSLNVDGDADASSSSSLFRRSNSDAGGVVILASNRPKRSAGRKKFKETRHPVYRGVRSRNNDKWVCEVREPNKKSRIWLGTYETAEMAARAHDVAALALRGRSACLNFADSMWRLPTPDSTDAKDIRKAASEAAEMFRQPMSPIKNLSGLKNVSEEKDNVFFLDEEVEFGMPGFLASMAEGLLLSPPPSGGSEFNQEDIENEGEEVSLWSFSI
ncbi:Dehydration-responsive element binding factor [Thalictrum thalictroides]|uniref:Dehydration-responsive element binding factor n=1 Tax=Thalictrum thalictroides TaxID=46969 RepID=A0A7J6WU73_THATH|nr:Dehydration-responsive element binding factor [Thalictrum thalictroides]